MGGSSLGILKGTLEVLILKILSPAPNHGYGIAQRLRKTSAELFQVEEGALYPALRRMEKKGLLRADWDVTDTGREARFYRLTAEGEHALRTSVEDWTRYVTAMNHVLEGGEGG